MTPERFWLAMAFFHLTVLTAWWQITAGWREPARCQLATWPWLLALARTVLPLAVLTYGLSLAASLVANADRLAGSHAPDFVDALSQPVDLVLAGHTHGGQVVIPFFGPPRTASRLPRRYAADLHDLRGTPLHVSRGVGMERGFTVPVRFLCPPEICVLDVRFP